MLNLELSLRGNSCVCFLNGISIDICDNNYNRQFTQVHIVLSNIAKTLDVPINTIQVVNKNDDNMTMYPVEKIIEMAHNVRGKSYGWSEKFIKIFK